MTCLFSAAIAPPSPSRNAGYLLALVTVVFGIVTQADPALAVDESIPCDPEPTDMSISYGDVVACSIDVVGDVDIFRFSGTVGEVVTLLVSRLTFGNITPCIELFDPGGSPIGSHCFAPGARIDLTLGETGLYSVLVSESGNNWTMVYTLTVERVAPPSFPATYICPECELGDNIDPIGDLDLFSFFGTAGDVVTLLVSRLTFGNITPCIELFDPGGSPIGSHCYAPGAQIDLTLGQTGLYSVLVSESGNNWTMVYTLSYQCLLGVCVDLIFADGFESGDISAWSNAVGWYAGYLNVDNASAHSGSFGLEVTVGGICTDPVDRVITSPPPNILGLFLGCNSITASDVQVVSPGATFAAGNSITLGDGFSVASGSPFTAVFDPALVNGLGYVEWKSAHRLDSYSARFDLSLDDLALAAGDLVELLNGYSVNGDVQFKVILKYNSTLMENRLVLSVRQDDGSYVNTPPGEETLLPADWNEIEVEWESGFGTGSLTVSVNEGRNVGLSGIFNTLQRIDEIRLGYVGGTVTTTSGNMKLDNFTSHE